MLRLPSEEEMSWMCVNTVVTARGWSAALSALALIGPPNFFSWVIDPVGKPVAKHPHSRHHKRHHRRRAAARSRPRHHHQRSSHHDFVLHVNHAHAAIHAAGDPADTISDFKFTPATLTITVGDTVTWTNNGPSPHTATANDGSFDTGTLQKGQSGSHTFSKSGTFAYICTIHPFMKGTIVVLGGSSSSGSSGSGSSSGGSSGSSGSSGSGSSSGSAGSGSTSSGSSSDGSLAFTGYDVALIVLLGAGMSATGLFLRRREGRETRRPVTKNTKSA